MATCVIGNSSVSAGDGPSYEGDGEVTQRRVKCSTSTMVGAPALLRSNTMSLPPPDRGCDPGNPPLAPRPRRNKGRESLVALGAAVVLTVYTAGYLRTNRAEQGMLAVDTVADVAALESTAPPLSLTPLDSLSATAEVPAVVDAPFSRPRHEDEDDHDEDGESEGHADSLPTAPAAAGTSAAPVPSATAVPATVVPATAAPTAGPATPAPTAALPASGYRDGTFVGSGSSRHGGIEAAVVIDGGRITSVQITQCHTRYSCSWIEPLLGQVIARQSAKVDRVSGATDSSKAFRDAVTMALQEASA